MPGRAKRAGTIIHHIGAVAALRQIKEPNARDA